MKFLPDTNACITLLRQKNANLVFRWRAKLPSDILICSVVVYEFSRVPSLKVEDWEV